MIAEKISFNVIPARNMINKCWVGSIKIKNFSPSNILNADAEFSGEWKNFDTEKKKT